MCLPERNAWTPYDAIPETPIEKSEYTTGVWVPASPNAQRVNTPSDAIIVRRNECRSWSSRGLPFPVQPSQPCTRSIFLITSTTYHLEGVELFLDLLREHWCQSVARCQFRPTIIFLTMPGVVENDSGAERRISLALPRGRARGALGILTQAESSHEIVFVPYGEGLVPLVAAIVVGCAGSTGEWRIRDVGHLGQFKGRSLLDGSWRRCRRIPVGIWYMLDGQHKFDEHLLETHVSKCLSSPRQALPLAPYRHPQCSSSS